MHVWSPPKIRARQIVDSDARGVADLLKKGFGRRRTLQYWRHALERLAAHPRPDGTPKYGYLMERDGVPIGVILLIHSTVPTREGPVIRCNVSSWYVEPAYRGHAPMLVTQAMKRKDVTYVNISPVRHTRPIVEAQGFVRYNNGQLVAVAVPALLGSRAARILDARAVPDAPHEPFERKLLLDHAGYGCIAFWYVAPERAYPFVFAPRVLKGVVRCAQLIYCRDIDDYVRFARPIGSFLGGRGRNLLLIDANGPIRGLIGCYIEGRAPKYFKGAVRPRVGDLAYTEAALFGM
jgi:hypothetical protein